MPVVELVDVRTTDRLLLTGAFYPAASQLQGNALPVDAVLMIHGNGVNFYSPYQRDFAARLSSLGLPVLTANTRGHDMVNLSIRVDGGTPTYGGTSFDRIDDSIQDFDAWLEFLAVRGFSRILLWAHSRGALKAAFYIAHRPQQELQGAVLSSPPSFSHARWMQSDRAAEFAELLEQCKTAVASGALNTPVHVTLPVPYLSGPAQYIDSYGPGEKYNLSNLLEDVTLPILATTGELELASMFAFSGVGTLLDDLATRKSSLCHLTIPGADHVYSKQRGLVVEIVEKWLRELGLAAVD